MVCSSPEKSVSARFATTCLARQRAQRFNIIEKLFQGTMMMRTKCLECERCTERKENFQDVSVPLKAEGNADSDSETGGSEVGDSSRAWFWIGDLGVWSWGKRCRQESSWDVCVLG